MVPLIFEVDAAGVARLRRDTSLPFSTTLADSATLAETIDASGPFVPADEAIQALLASAAFPLAFGARPLCECRLACGDGQREVTAMECPGPVPGKPLSKLSCSAYSATHGGQTFKLCRSNFLDGGFLDNAPVGLAVEQAEAFAPPRTLYPLSVLLVDPEVRRPRPDPAPAPEKGAQGITDAVALANNLVTTAREQRLAEAVASRHWNLSTRTLLRRSASALVAYGSIVSPLVDPRATQADEAEPPVWRPKSEERGAFGRFLDGCLRRPPSAAKLEVCAAAVEGHDTSNFLLSSMPALVLRARPPCPRTRHSTSRRRFRPSSTLWQAGELEPASRNSRPLRRGRWPFWRTSCFITSAQVTDETALRRMRAACLRSALAVKALPGRTIQVSRIVLTGAVRQLTAPGVPPAVSSAATELLATLATASTAQLFSGGLFGPLQEALSAVPRESLSEVARNAARRLSLLGQLRPRIARLSDAAVRISQDADEIESDARGQRRLFVATRFSPLAGAKLEHFAGFMDRPLRELDYYTGIYEALRATANRACSEQDPYFTGRPEPLLKQDGSWELDPSQEQTQRCYGAAMGSFIEYLQILASPKAGPVVLALARRELSAWLGSSSAADRLASTPEWSWLGPTPPDLRKLGSMGTALAVLLEPATPCTPSAKEALCIGELNFQQFLVRLEAAGYQPESKAMEAALADQGRWLSQTVQRALDRAGTIEIAQDSSQSSTEKAVNVIIGGGETVSRYAEREGKIPVPGRSVDHPAPAARRRVVSPHRPRPPRALPGGAGRGGRKHRPELARAATPARSLVLGGFHASAHRHPVQLGCRLQHPRRTRRAAPRSSGNRLRASLVAGVGGRFTVRRGVRRPHPPGQAGRLVRIPEPHRRKLELPLRGPHRRRPERNALLAHPSSMAVGPVVRSHGHPLQPVRRHHAAGREGLHTVQAPDGAVEPLPGLGARSPVPVRRQLVAHAQLFLGGLAG